LTGILILGAGLSGLFAAVSAARHGVDVTLVAAGRGGLSLSHGCIDVWSTTKPFPVLSRLKKTHPYRIVGKHAATKAVETFVDMAGDANYPFTGSLSQHTIIPTAVGALHPTAFAPDSLAQNTINKSTPITVATITGLRDFFPLMLANNLKSKGYTVERTIQLSLPGLEPRRDLYSTDLANYFEDAASHNQIVKLWKAQLPNVDLLALPAVLGLRNSHHVFTTIQDSLGIKLLEIPTPPPSLPGLRLEMMLSSLAVQSGVNLMLGSSATGRIDRRGTSKRVSGISLRTSGPTRQIDAERVILATGGFLNGGLVADRDAGIRESIFNLPIDFEGDFEELLAPSLFDTQPIEMLGLHVNSRMQPIAADGEPFYENLFAAGGIISGPDRQSEGSRQGIDLSTALRAVEAALE
jgi:glycerol-3-phosphate dehydrogenase subunit B